MAEPTTTGDVAALISEGNAALSAGDAFTARQRFRQALEIDPDQVDAWIGLAGAVRPYRERREHLQRALAIAPGHPAASAALVEVEARIAAGELLAPAPVAPREARRNQALADVTITEEPAPAAPVEVLHCYIHPGRETGLRCTSCDRPICADCVRPAAVGQLCPECAKARRPVNYQVSWFNLAVSGVISVVYGVVVSFLALQILGLAGFFSLIISFMLGPLAGNLLVRLLDRVTHNKRGRVLQVTVGVCYSFGALPWMAVYLLFGGGWTALLLGVFTLAAVTAAAAALR